jgi:hypothetical protein
MGLVVGGKSAGTSLASAAFSLAWRALSKGSGSLFAPVAEKAKRINCGHIHINK